ncbi:MAG: hypothetical protein L0G89_10730, partial [Janibacter sp.]|nr:hypothetical protein [Janibacter sp.]
ESEDSYADGATTTQPQHGGAGQQRFDERGARADGPGARLDEPGATTSTGGLAGTPVEPASSADVDQPGAGVTSAGAPVSGQAGSSPAVGANDSSPAVGTRDSTRGWETEQSASPVEPAPDAARGWESSDPTRPDVAPEGRDLPSSTDTEATQRSGYLDPEERPEPGAHKKPGLMDKVRGKVEEIRGDERPRS